MKLQVLHDASGNISAAGVPAPGVHVVVKTKRQQKLSIVDLADVDKLHLHYSIRDAAVNHQVRQSGQTVILVKRRRREKGQS